MNHEAFPQFKVLFQWQKIPPICLSYIGARRTTFAKAYGIKLRCYWERFEENDEIGNVLGTHWKLDENIVGTH
jgi:hypothetical protein